MKCLEMIFGCTHPMKALRVSKEQTTESTDSDFDKVTYHLFCSKCGKGLKLVHSKTKLGVRAFLRKGGSKHEESIDSIDLSDHLDNLSEERCTGRSL